MKNAINWFEIPVLDFERARSFYSQVMGEEVVEYPMEGDMKYGVFTYDTANGVGGAIVQSEQQPSMDGTTVYLNGGEDLSQPLSRVEASGGKILMPKTAIGENGFMALFVDTEGNKVAFHSMK